LDEQLFHKQPARPPQPSVELNALATKLRLVEERYKNIQKRTHLSEDALLGFERDTRAELDVLKTRITELRKVLVDMNAKVDGMVAELSSVVQQHEFKAVEKYLDLWQPMRWVTVEEAKRMVDHGR